MKTMENLEEFSQKIADDTWEGKEYLKLVDRVTNLEKDFSEDKKEDKTISNPYVAELFTVNSLVNSFDMMAFLGDFGDNSPHYYSLSRELVPRVEGLIKKLYK